MMVLTALSAVRKRPDVTVDLRPVPMHCRCLDLTVFLGPVEPSVDRVEHGHAPVSRSQRFTIATNAQFTQSLEHRAVGAAERLVIATRLAARGINSEVDLELYESTPRPRQTPTPATEPLCFRRSPPPATVHRLSAARPAAKSNRSTMRPKRSRWPGVRAEVGMS